VYLKRLYIQHKGWFLFVVCFIIAQLFIIYKWGVVCSPFYNYGMYSEVMKPAEKYKLINVEVNGKALQAKDFTPQYWDKIMLPLSLNNEQQQWNSYVYKHVVQVYLHANDSSPYVNNYSSVQFQQWYKNYLQPILSTKIDSLKIRDTAYIFPTETQR
jgi:hypothetical protein